jgi:hypothetical protein
MILPAGNPGGRGAGLTSRMNLLTLYSAKRPELRHIRLRALADSRQVGQQQARCVDEVMPGFLCDHERELGLH